MLLYKKININNLNNVINTLKIGDFVSMSGYVYTARDAAHKRMIENFHVNKKFPFDINNQCIYYTGPTPQNKNFIGSCGPTTSSRMDKFTPFLLDHGLKCMIGKGERDSNVINSIKKNKAIYIVTIGGAGAYLSTKIKNITIIDYFDLGCESIKKLDINDFPGIVAIDINGNNIFSKKCNK